MGEVPLYGRVLRRIFSKSKWFEVQVADRLGVANVLVKLRGLTNCRVDLAPAKWLKDADLVSHKVF